MYIRIACTVSVTIFILATVPVIAGPATFSATRLGTPQQTDIERVHYRCHNPYVWVPDGTIAGATGGYPYYGWYGYPYVPFRCVRVLHARRYRHVS